MIRAGMRSVILLRGINVGGANRLSMAALRGSLGAAGFAGVRSYIQSGNLVVDGAVSAGAVRAAIRAAHGFDVAAVVLDAAALAEMRAALPFEGPGDRIVMAFFVEEGAALRADIERLREAAVDGEDVALHPLGVFLNLPNGQARSRMAAEAERRLGVSVTARNLRTIEALIALAGC